MRQYILRRLAIARTLRLLKRRHASVRRCGLLRGRSEVYAALEWQRGAALSDEELLFCSALLSANMRAQAKAAGWGVMASHRSGETEDSYIADLSVGLSTGQIKSGAPCRSERLAKYNQILRIEEELGADAVYAGEAMYRHISW